MSIPHFGYLRCFNSEFDAPERKTGLLKSDFAAVKRKLCLLNSGVLNPDLDAVKIKFTQQVN